MFGISAGIAVLCAGLSTPHLHRPQVSTVLRCARVSRPRTHTDRRSPQCCAVRGSPDPAPTPTAGLPAPHTPHLLIKPNPRSNQLQGSLYNLPEFSKTRAGGWAGWRPAVGVGAGSGDPRTARRSAQRGDDLIDVVADGELLDASTPVVVIEVRGTYVKVQTLED